jgi:hypothetical protein
MEFIMNNDKSKPADNHEDGKQSSETERSAQPDRQTWIGGGSEPVHPDDIGADGQYLPGEQQRKQGESKPCAGK